MPNSDHLLIALRASLERLGLKSARLVVAVSGGPDSVALALGLAELAPELGLKLHLAHLDHQMRLESADDARFVADLARRLGLPVTIEAIDVRARAAARGEGLEEAGRNARYQFLERVRDGIGARAIVVGHTADDQTETRLLHVARGSGLRGLAGMSEDSLLHLPGGIAARVVRPLLGVNRAETHAYCRTRGEVARDDQSNRDLAFARNRLRAKVVPSLRRINPRVDAALERLARAAADAEAFVEAELTRRVDGAVEASSDFWRVPRAVWNPLPDALKRALLRRAAAAIVPGFGDGLDAAAIERALALATHGAGRALDWPGGIRFRIERDDLIVETRNRTPRMPLEEHAIRAGEEIGLEDLPTQLSLGAMATLRVAAAEARCDRAAADHLDLDLDKLGNAPLVVRARQPGDWLAPEGMTGRKKLQDLLVDAGIPRAERDRVPIVATGSDVVWVVGLRRDRRFLADASSRKILCFVVNGDEDDK